MTGWCVILKAVCFHASSQKMLLLLQLFPPCVDSPVLFFHFFPFRRFQRVPGVEDCYTHDAVCMFEADQQYFRDKMVEKEILHILKKRSVDGQKEKQ